MAYMHMITFYISHNNVMMYAVSPIGEDEADIDDMAKAMCEKRGGNVSVSSLADDDIYTDLVWEFSYINSDGRIWRVTQDDMWEWEREDEYRTDDNIFFTHMNTQDRRTRLEVGKWLIMGDEVRDSLPRAKAHHKRERIRKERRMSHKLIQEQLS